MMHAYGPSLADQGHSSAVAEEAERERWAAWERAQKRTGWAYPEGMADDLRASAHWFENGGKSACGKWDAPNHRTTLYEDSAGAFACTRCGPAFRRWLSTQPR